MKINFKVKYRTVMGQSLWLMADHKALGNNTLGKMFPLQFLNLEQWGASVEITSKDALKITYQYVLKDDNTGVVLQEWKKRTLNISDSKELTEIDVLDTWSSAGSPVYSFETAMFTRILSKATLEKLSKQKYTHQFTVLAPMLKKEESVIVLGNCAELGNWNPNQGIKLKRLKQNTYTVQLDLTKVQHPIAYKYALYNSKTKQLSQYELGENRITFPINNSTHQVLIDDEMMRLPVANFWKGAGVSIPVFSLRTENSMGVGEFLDLKPMGDWAKQTGLRLIQILPINDTSANDNWVDSYPYASISVFALHPQYLKISALPYKMPKTFTDNVKKVTQKLNESPTVSYEEMMQQKRAFLHEIFQKYKAEFLEDKAFQKFFAQNKSWLMPYAVFCVKKEENQTPDFTKWKDFTTYSSIQLSHFAKDNEAVQYHYFVQYQLHNQLLEAVSYLHEQGIVLKGDIPIGIYRYSCDAWVSPDLYNMEMQAGAPPDDFAVKGQNWGFPTYNWNKMEQDGFQWWKNRFTQMGQYFDSFRIDHILGFFRIWQIPTHAVEGILGYFEPALPIQKSELEARGIAFDYQRFCKPFINDIILEKLFGDDAQFVKNTFLIEKQGWVFQPQYDTQQKIATYLNSNPDKEAFRQGLYDLVANVLLLETTAGKKNAFHPRYGLETTLSYAFLSNETKQQLHELYIDYFYVRQENFWKEQGFRKLPAIKRATNMLICGEDLGMVPACVPDVMQELGILSLEVQRMPKNPKTLFFNPADAPYMSVVSPSSHDTSTLRGWWEENQDLTQQYYNTILGHQGKAPAVMTTEIAIQIIEQHFNSQAMLAIFPIQDYLGIEARLRHKNVDSERINIPAIIPHYWNYRMHLTLAELIAATDFNQKIRDLVVKSVR